MECSTYSLFPASFTQLVLLRCACHLSPRTAGSASASGCAASQPSPAGGHLSCFQSWLLQKPCYEHWKYTQRLLDMFHSPWEIPGSAVALLYGKCTSFSLCENCPTFSKVLTASTLAPATHKSCSCSSLPKLGVWWI